MSKCRYDLSEDCHNKDCLNCILDKIANELGDLIKTIDDMGCSTKQFRVALGIVNQYRKGDKE